MNKKFVNLTPHEIKLNGGESFPPSGTIARVSNRHSDPDENGIMSIRWGDVTGLPEETEGTVFIVSALVAAKVNRKDVVSPASGHPFVIRDEKGQIVSVPGFVSSLK